jgi:hypothetical protein
MTSGYQPTFEIFSTSAQSKDSKDFSRDRYVRPWGFWGPSLATGL